MRADTSPGTRISRAIVATSGAIALAASATAGRPASNCEGRLPPALDAPAPAQTDGPVVQLALLLDTSNSMDGLINQARAQLWGVVNEMARIERGCEPVQLQVALFQYGNDSLEASDGYVQLRTPFTTNLDIISEQLFSLSTNGGSEYCGEVIGRAVDRLDWIAIEDEPCYQIITRMIVIAGNEPFSQGMTPFRSSIPSATNKGITVHTVFCGPRSEGVSTFWQKGATLGEGRYCAIDHNHRVVEIPTPYDTVIGRLNAELNETYIHYGANGAAAARRQFEQDTANRDASEAQFARRANAKAGALYSNAGWDLVDAFTRSDLDLDSVDKSTLPERYRELSTDALNEQVEMLARRRGEIQSEIQEAYSARSAFIEENQDKNGSASTLETVLLETIRASFETGVNPGAMQD